MNEHTITTPIRPAGLGIFNPIAWFRYRKKCLEYREQALHQAVIGIIQFAGGIQDEAVERTKFQDEAVFGENQK